MSFTIKRLLQRYNRLSAAALQDRPQQVFEAAPNSNIGLWRAWAYAESYLLLKDWSRAIGWLNACEEMVAARHIQVGQVWLAEFLSSKGTALHDIGETGQALPYLDKALCTWVELFERLQIPPEQQERPLAEEIAELFETIAREEEELEEIRRFPQQQVLTWITERLVIRRLDVACQLIPALATAGEFERGRQVAEETFIWLPLCLEPQSQPWFKFSLRVALGELERAAGDVAASVREFDRAARQLENDHRSEALDRRWQALFSKANSLLRMGRYPEARKLYRDLRGHFAQRGNDEGVRRVRYALLLVDYDENPQTPIEAELRALARDHEVFINEQRDPQNFHVYKQNLEQVYRLLLTILAASPEASLPIALDCLSIVRGLRETYKLANLDRPQLLKGAEWLSPVLQNPMMLLAERLACLPGTGLLVLESGHHCLVLIVIYNINNKAEVVVSTIGESAVRSFLTLVEQVREISDQLIARTISAKSVPSTEIIQTAQDVWQVIPPETRQAIQACTTLFYSPSAWGVLDELPLELIHNGETWLGLAQNIARAPSLSALDELLAPNHIPRQLENCAYIVRAEDPPELDELESADRVAQNVQRATGILGLQSTLDKAPTPQSALRALDNGNRLFHYEGHGMAGNLGECLYLNHSQVLDSEDLRILSGYRTPFTYLNCCLVGRARHLQGGKQKGIGLALLDQAAPAIIAASYSVPDYVLGDVALAFYRAAARSPVGAALREARLALEKAGYHPVSWASFALQGDPFFTVAPGAGGSVQGSREFTLQWPAHLTRYLASQNQDDLQACLEDLQTATRVPDPELAALHQEAEAWIRLEIQPKNALSEKKAETLMQKMMPYSIAGCVALRQLLGMRRIQMIASRKSSKTKGKAANNQVQSELLAEEIRLGLRLSLHLQDVFAFSAFAIEHAKHLTLNAEVSLTETMQVLKKAKYNLEGLTAYHERFSPLAEQINERYKLMDNKVLFDLSQLGI